MKRRKLKRIPIKALILSIIIHIIIFIFIGGIIIFESPMVRENFLSADASLISKDYAEEELLTEDSITEPQLEEDAQGPIAGVITSDSPAAMTTMTNLIPKQKFSSDYNLISPLSTFTPSSELIEKATQSQDSARSSNLLKKFELTNFFGLMSQRDNPLYNHSKNMLVGTFYDLKQSSRKKLLPHEAKHKEEGTQQSEGIASTAYMNIIKEFLNSWNPSVFKNYYRGPNKLQTPYLFIPVMPAEEAPKAFQVEKEVDPTRWVIHYKGNFVAPTTGRFRFVGLADDILIVRFKKKNILNASILNYYVPNWLEIYSNQTAMGKFGNWSYQASDWQDLKQGNSYPIEMLVGEMPGLGFFAFLMIQEEGVNYADGTDGLPVLPLFKTLDIGLPSNIQDGAPRVLQDGPVFGR